MKKCVFELILQRKMKKVRSTMKITSLFALTAAVLLTACNQDAAKSSAAAVSVVSCEQKSLADAYGFNENVEASTCETMKTFGMEDYNCSVEQNVFGTTHTAAHVTTDSKSVYAFANADQCIDTLKKWIELVP